MPNNQKRCARRPRGHTRRRLPVSTANASCGSGARAEPQRLPRASPLEREPAAIRDSARPHRSLEVEHRDTSRARACRKPQPRPTSAGPGARRRAPLPEIAVRERRHGQARRRAARPSTKRPLAGFGRRPPLPHAVPVALLRVSSSARRARCAGVRSSSTTARTLSASVRSMSGPVPPGTRTTSSWARPSRWPTAYRTASCDPSASCTGPSVQTTSKACSVRTNSVAPRCARAGPGPAAAAGSRVRGSGQLDAQRRCEAALGPRCASSRTTRS